MANETRSWGGLKERKERMKIKIIQKLKKIIKRRM